LGPRIGEVVGGAGLRPLSQRRGSGVPSRGLDGELRRRAAAQTAILYAFDVIEHDGEDRRNRPFFDRKNVLARLLRDTEAGILFNEHIAQAGPVVFAHACRLGAEGVVSKKVDGTYRSGACRSGSRSAIPPASPCSGSGARCRIGAPGSRQW